MKTRHELSSAKIELLRSLDRNRAWVSLDDTRHCVLCERTISGHSIRITRDRNGRLQLRCPSRGCRSTPDEWIHPENPLVSEEAWKDWVRLLDSLCDEEQDRTAPPRRQYHLAT